MIPTAPLELKIEQSLTWGEMVIFSDDPTISNFDRLARLRQFLIDRSNWAAAEIDNIRDGEETTAVINAMVTALQAAAVPKVKRSRSKTGHASKTKRPSPNGRMTLPMEKHSTSSPT